MGYDVDRKPGAFAHRRARSLSRGVLALLGVAALLVCAAGYAGFGLGSTLLAAGALAALYAVKRFFDGQLDSARRWTVGAKAETAVGETLNELRRRRFVVMHDIARRGEGNVDHVVSGPTGVYLIETKSGRYRLTDLTKAKRQAARLADQLGVWVTPVICRPGNKVFRHHRVWIVPRGQLVAWIEKQRNAPCDFARLAAFADAVD